MTRSRLLSHVVIAGLLWGLSACATAPARPVPGGEAIVVETPTFKVGDEWRFSGGPSPGVVRVVAVEGDGIVTGFSGYTRCEGCRAFRDRHLTTTKILQRDGQPWPDAVVGDKNLQFPLQVGKEWTQEIELRAGGGAMLPYRNRYRVEAYEEIQTKAVSSRLSGPGSSRRTFGPAGRARPRARGRPMCAGGCASNLSGEPA